ncbi:DUF1289 domain-containing protein [Alkanindiges sp. WGS2144]|uniref:DUF1289 domain-containing protein n=1 Tax=Alkanindiges sp. WGS2144 TaxID=3366808 RepID=UPI0037519B31
MKAALTPCAGKCSTVFGDSVCRGCRRFSHEVINWNAYTLQEQQSIWQRLDSQLDQILLPLVSVEDEQALEMFLTSQLVRLPEHASQGRKIYHALRICQRKPDCLERSGLKILPAHLQKIWRLFEQRIYSLAIASFEMAWLRAAQFRDEETEANSSF